MVSDSAPVVVSSFVGVSRGLPCTGAWLVGTGGIPGGRITSRDSVWLIMASSSNKPSAASYCAVTVSALSRSSSVTVSSSSIGSNIEKGALTAPANAASGANPTVTSSPSSILRKVPKPFTCNVPDSVRAAVTSAENSVTNACANGSLQAFRAHRRAMISGSGSVFIYCPP